jgi:hypothetical protein
MIKRRARMHTAAGHVRALGHMRAAEPTDVGLILGRQRVAGWTGRVCERTTYPLSTRGAAPVGNSASHDAAWFAEIGAGQIERISPDGAITEFPLTETPVF